MSERIYLIGFMGTGKTTVGTALAEALGWALYDSDQELVRAEGREIAAIFAEEGEPAFRRLEAQMLAELAARRQAVITTGGGAVIAAANRQLMQETGYVVALTASVEEIVARVSSDPGRPLLQADDLRARVETLLNERAGLYACADLTVDTTGRTVERIVLDISTSFAAASR